VVFEEGPEVLNIICMNFIVHRVKVLSLYWPEELRKPKKNLSHYFCLPA
jgi:hypothetical protein